MGKKRAFVPNKLKWYREQAGYTQKDVANILKINTPTMISSWELDLARPGLEYVLKLMHLYHTLPSELFAELSDQYYEEVAGSVKLHRKKKTPEPEIEDDS